MSREWTVPVAFTGDGAGDGPLAWGQQEIWSAMQRQQTWLPVGGALPAAPGATLEGYVEELRFLVQRHPTMRTLLRFADDGRTHQVVHGAGEVDLLVVDTGAGDDPAAVAAGVRDRFWYAPHDPTTQWPVRMAVVRAGGVPTHVVAVFCHLAMDAFGAAAMVADIASRDPDTGAAAGPPPELQPLAQARWQASAAGQRQNEQSLRHWAKLLGTVPPRRFPAPDDIDGVEPGDGGEQVPRYWEGEYTSVALPPALRALAGRLDVATSPLLLTALFATWARLTGDLVGVTQIVVSNRFRPGLSDVVAPVNQTGLCVADLDVATFAEAAPAVARAMMRAYKHAYYDPTALDALVERVGAERDGGLDIACFFNDRRQDGRDEPGEVLDADALRAAAVRGSFRWARRVDEPFERLFVHVDDAPGALRLTICADTRFIPPRVIRAVARGIEAVLVEAAVNPAAPVVAAQPAEPVPAGVL
jgi:hypothetical protein